MDEGLIEQKKRLIKAGRTAVDELIKVAESIMIKNLNVNDDSSESETALAADKMKNAAASKKLAIFDAFEILKKIEEEEEIIEYSIKHPEGDNDSNKGFAEKHANKKND